MARYSVDVRNSSVVIKEASSRLDLGELLEGISGMNRDSGSVVQLFNPRSVISRAHLAGAYADAVNAFDSKTNISKSVAMEMLLFAAMTRQISEAIAKAGIKSQRSFIVFANSKPAYGKARQLLSAAKEFRPAAAASLERARSLGIMCRDVRDLDMLVLQGMAVSRLD